MYRFRRLHTRSSARPKKAKMWLLIGVLLFFSSPGVRSEGPLEAYRSAVGTPLEKILRNSGITHVVATGVATSNAVEGTVRHASDLGFAPIVLRDCVANYSKEMNDFVLDKILPMHAVISDSKEYVEALKRSGKV